MAAERQEYPAMLSQLQPPQAVAILNDRVQQVGKLNNAIADWLSERRRVEEQYSAGLRRLVQKPLDGADLGVFSVPWTTLMASTDNLADSHMTLAAKIGADVERPLREFTSTSREMSQMSTIQGNLQSLAKDVERAQQKTEKLSGKGERAGVDRVATASSDLDSARSHWDSQAPYVFENLQALDETRLSHLRDCLTQFQTHEMDQVERNRVSGEQCLNVLLNVEVGDEVKSFATKAVQNKPTLAKPQRNSIAYTSPTRQASVPNTLAQTLSRSEEDLTRERSVSVEEKSKSRFKGLKRLGTVVGRRRESKLPVTDSESPQPRPKVSSLNSFGGRFGRSRDNAPTLATMQETSPRSERPRSPPRLGSEIFSSPSEARADPTTPPPSGLGLDTLPHINGASGGFLPITPASRSIPTSSHQSDLRDVQPPPPNPVFAERKSSLAALEGQKDNEGYSVPPQTLDPISQAQEDAAFADDSGASPFNVNIRDASIQQDAGAADADLATAATTLQAPPPSTKRTSTVRGRRQDRNSTLNSTPIAAEQSVAESQPEPSASETRDVPKPSAMQKNIFPAQFGSSVSNTGLTQSPSGTFAPGQVAASTFSPFTPQQEQQSPFRPDSRATTSVDQGHGETQSIRSATTTASQGLSKHPDLTESGLNSSIIETLNARFESGRLSSSSFIGEIALAYNPADFSSPFGTENIRLENFASLEKVAPNPSFITQLPDKTGEYSINLAQVAKTQIAFKYQVRLDDANSQAPLITTPAFRIEANQCSVIVSYSLNPAFTLQGQESITLSNVMLALTIEGAKATGCQSKPVGTFAREKNLIYWQLNDVELTPGAAPEKLLARFTTESEAKSGSVEARWELTGDHTSSLGSGLSVSQQGTSGGGGDGTDPFADESAQAGNWRPVQGVKRLTAGSYVSK